SFMQSLMQSSTSPLLSDIFFFSVSVYLCDLHSFPTRRSSDLMTGKLQNGFMFFFWGVAIIWFITMIPNVQLPYFLEMPEFIQGRSEEHTSELQSRFELVCRLLLEKKIYFALENNRSKETAIDPGNSCKEVLEMVKAIDSPHLGICWDMGHLYSNLTVR